MKTMYNNLLWTNDNPQNLKYFLYITQKKSAKQRTEIIKYKQKNKIKLKYFCTQK